MINNNLKFMKSKEISPHEFYFIDETLFNQLTIKLKEKGGGINISTLGNIEMDNFWYLSYGAGKVPMNISRVPDLNPNFKKEIYPPYYMIYGELRWDGTGPVLIVQFARNLGNKMDLEAFKKVTLRKRELINEALNQDFIF